MDTKAYPGKGLSLSQLVFALNEELKRTVYSPSFTLDKVLELNRDTSAALATIREWINSFVPVNRVSMDVLSLIPTHLHSQKDRFRASFVCRYWRRTFLHHAGLWSYLCLSKGEVYVKTLLERAKGSLLTILVSGNDPAMTLLPPYTKQITSLEFANSDWADIRLFSGTNSGHLPLLRTLNINLVRGINSDDLDVVIPPSRPLFSGAVGLKKFHLHLEGLPFLNHFVFPNLTSFELSMAPAEEFRGSQLLDFLEALPVLQVAHMKILTVLSLAGVPRKRVIVLRNVESLSLITSDGEPGYKLAAHISCPSVKYTFLTHMGEEGFDDFIPLEALPSSDALNAIIRQYTRSPIEEVTLEITPDSDNFAAYSLTFRSTDKTVIRLRFEVAEDDDDDDLEETLICDVFFKTSRAIRDLPLLANVKRLHMYGLLNIYGESFAHIADEFEGLLKSMGPLEELTISGCEMQPFFLPFLDYSKIVEYPPIRVLTLADPWDRFYEGVAVGLVNLARAQHELGMPFERVTVRLNGPPRGIEEGLKPWVGVVDYAPYDFSWAE